MNDKNASFIILFLFFIWLLAMVTVLLLGTIDDALRDILAVLETQ